MGATWQFSTILFWVSTISLDKDEKKLGVSDLTSSLNVANPLSDARQSINDND